MKTSPFHPGPLDELTPQEIEAMAAIKQGRKVADALRAKLELKELAQETICGWMLTPAGDWRLASGK